MASIPVDVYNPGQVFASLGFLELAHILHGPARGGFIWDDSPETRFVLETTDDGNPFERVLRFIVEADIYEIVPADLKSDFTADGPAATGAHGQGNANLGLQDGVALDAGATMNVVVSRIFPTGSPQNSAHPIRFRMGDVSFDVTHWSDGSSRRHFKLYSGNRTAFQIATAMVHGVRERPRKNQLEGDFRYKGIKSLWEERYEELIDDPFNVTTSMGGSFNFDPRGAWSALDAGYSPNDQKHGVEASPLVEMLAPIGMENARPDQQKTREVTYAIWKGLASPMLARPALAGAAVGLTLRTFQFTLGESGKNRIVTFAQEVAEQ